MTKPTARPDIRRLVELQRLLLQFHSIKRQVYHTTPDRQETDTEHSYTLAIAGWFLAQYFPGLDTNTVIRLALVHDLLELHAGDTFAYGDRAILSTKADREAAAVQKLAADWADFPDMVHDIRSYEARESAEAKFVYALDKVMPAILNYLNEGDIWRRYHITIDQFIAEKEAKVPVSPEVYAYYTELLAILRKHPEFFAPNPSAV